LAEENAGSEVQTLTEGKIEFKVYTSDDDEMPVAMAHPSAATTRRSRRFAPAPTTSSRSRRGSTSSPSPWSARRGTGRSTAR